jgi:D-alanyl-D-alanine carboxypeptidase/D-alanyl-D-alanine-endopeptidase (penicillin-binding protein 4)
VGRTVYAAHHKHKLRRGARARVQQEVGVLVMSEDGNIVLDQLSDKEFNPASAVKIITAYGALKTFGPNYRFSTNVLTNGELNKETGVVDGDVYVQGIDPNFEHQDAMSLCQALSDAGVKQIKGRLLVSPGFSYNSDPDPLRSARSLLRVWHYMGGGARITAVSCATVPEIPQSATSLVEYKSEPLRDTLKEMLCFSLNHVAEQLGRTVGGVHKLEEIVAQDTGTAPGAIKLASASGLGKNRVKPRDMMLVLKALRTELQTNEMDFKDIFPVAGIDRGTLDERFTSEPERGSVVAKTGTLPGTDGGSSALVGMFRSQKEDLYFVIFCWKGSVVGFRHQQDELIRKLQAQRGGPKPYEYGLAAPSGGV